MTIKIDNITTIINNITNIFKKVIENIEIYYNIEMEILNNYNINNLNYEDCKIFYFMKNIGIKI